MSRPTSVRILAALLAGWMQWTFADPTGARSRAMYGVAAPSAATLAPCHGPANGQERSAAPTAHGTHAAHVTSAPHAGHDAHAVASSPEHGTDADTDAASNDSSTDAPPSTHHHGCALCPLACCAGVVLPVTAAPTAAQVALVATAPSAPWPPHRLATSRAAHRLPFATGPPTPG